MDPQLSERLARLPPEKLALLMERMREKEGGRPPAPTIPRRTGDGPCPPSFAQQRLWFVDQLEAGTYAYNVLSVTRFDGALDVAAMQRALKAVVARHEALRTVFEVVDDAPVQVVLPRVSIPLELEDLRHLPPDAREAELSRRVNLEPRRPFDLRTGPLLRTSLLRLAEDRHVLLLTLHHIISDGWSRGVMVREISTAYTAYVAGEEPALPELPVQYPDYAVWQRGWLEGDNLRRQLDYWTGRLRGAPPALHLPTDRPRPPLQSFEGRLHRFRVPGPLADALRALAREESATLYMVLLAAFKVLLGRFAGQDDVVVGTPVANRGRVETEGLVGFFANTLALRTDLSGTERPPFREVLRRVRETAVGAYAHEELPFERLVEALHPERDLSRSPVFQAMFLLDNTPVKTLRLPGLSLVPVAVDTGISSFDLSLLMEEKEDGLAGGLEYAAALFDEDTVARMAACYLSLLEGIAADPERRASELPLLDAAERRRVLDEPNRTGTEYPGLLAVHRRFAEQARRAPGAVAVVAGAETLSYGELHARAARLARALRGRGVGPESRVGILVERSPEMLVAVLGVLEAGAAYVPLDPEYPAERLRFMAADAGMRLVLAGRGAAAPVADGMGVEVLAPDAGEAGGPAGPEGEAVEPDGASAAYVIYTSGSTGTPKGVVVEHRSLAGYVEAAKRAYSLAPADRVLQFASLSFDISVEEIFPTLCSGAALVLRSPGAVGSVDAFLDEVRRGGVTMMSLPTAFWHEVVLGLESGTGELPPGLRLVVLGGERAQPERVAAWHARAAGVRLVNTYGPTEATVIATLHELAAEDGERVPIGRPIANARAYVLDAALEPVPTGVPGELFVGGAGVARGYLGRPDLTAGRFVPDPFGGEPGARLYRTGDRVRWGRDGALDFLGRVDAQVKVRGFRVEPAEVEAAIRAHPGVEAAVVAAREGGAGSVRLVGYYVPAGREGDGEGRPGAEELRAHLSGRLPDHMVPAALVEVAEWPLTPGGKVDLRALPDPAEAPPPPERDPTPLEEVLAGIWADVLQVEHVGVDGNLFDLGAHSLQVTRVLSQVKSLFGVEVPVRSLFLRPTVASMAAELLLAAPSPARVERTAEVVLRVSGLTDEEVDGMAPSAG